MRVYDANDLKRLISLPSSTVRSLTRAGHIHPFKEAGRLNYTFQDLIVLRTASALRAAAIPTRTINRALRRIRDHLPAAASLSGLSITTSGSRIAVRVGQASWDSESGQYSLALDVAAATGSVEVITRAQVIEVAAQKAQDYFQQASAIEQDDPAGAETLYERSLESDPEHLEARINLGRLLHLRGKLHEAEEIYNGTNAAEPLLFFNLAVLFEDLNREPDAIRAYRSALALDPAMGDAHFNLARLHQRAGNSKDSLRHLLAYRRFIKTSET
jgi:tetratricopeptide (TPR) repeat protein